MKHNKNIFRFIHLTTLMFFLSISSPVKADTYISGGFIYDEYWTQGEGPYIIEGIITVPVETFSDNNGNGIWDDAEEYEDINDNGQWDPGEPLNDTDDDGVWDDREFLNDINGNNEYDGALSLVIAPGTELRFAEDAQLRVNGLLLAEGTLENPIRMIRDDSAAAWGGVQFSYASSSQSVLDYVEISGAGNAVSAYSVSANLTISNCLIHDNSIGFNLSSSSPTISNCEVSNNSTGFYLLGSSSPHINHCTIKENSSYGITITDTCSALIENNWIGINGNGIHYSETLVSSASELVIQNNVIVFNSSSGIDLSYSSNNLKKTVLYNTIAYNGYSGITVKGYSSTYTNPVEITGNIVVRNGGYGIYSQYSTDQTVGYNDVWGNALSYYGVDVPDTDISEDPLFDLTLDTTAYHLLPDSPCLTAGPDAGEIGAYGNSGNPACLEVLVISFPNGGGSLIKGRYYTIAWDSSNLIGNIQIDLYKGDTNVLQLAAAAPNTGSYPFNPPFYLANGSDYRIGISAESGTIWDFSNTYFTIEDEYSNLPHHFEFSIIPSPQTVDTPFSVTITAMDSEGNFVTDFNGTVILSSNVGMPNPTNVSLENGTKEFPVTVDTPGYLNLTCDSYGVTGSSDFFTVSDDDSCLGSVQGRVVDSRGDPVWGAEVSIFNPALGQQVGESQLTDVNGNYEFTNLECVAYTIQVEKNDAYFIDAVKLDISRLPIKAYDITLQLNTATNGTPVILIPGILGSSSQKWSPYPKLSYEKPDRTLHIHDPRHPVFAWQKVVGFYELKEDLEALGYKVFECPWDWRLDAEDARDEYFKPVLADALSESTTGKVHVISHSTGGLIVRSHIQSIEYDNEIDKFAMVGTPNLGSSNPYYIWEGGDPKLIDDIQDEGVAVLINFYTNTIQNLWEETYCMTGWEPEHKVIRTFVRTFGKSLLQLMNTEEFLNRKYYQDTAGVASAGNENTWLKTLNSDPYIPNLMSDGSDASDGKVHVGIFAGNIPGDSTVTGINVGLLTSLYEDGFPLYPRKKNVVKGNGDGTVPYASAIWPHEQGWARLVGEIQEEHSGLIKAFNENGSILNFLSDGAITKELLPKGIDEALVQSSLSLSISAGMRLSITDALARETGVNPVTLEIKEEIPESEVFFTAQGGEIGVLNPLEGLYNVSIFGEVDRNFHLDITYLGDKGMEIIKLKGFRPVTVGTFQLSVSSTGDPMVTIIPSVETPSGLFGEPYVSGDNLLTRLTWTISVGAEIASYNIYGVSNTEPYFVKIGTVAAGVSSFDTTHAWSSEPSIPLMTYVVTAVKNDGSESFFSNETQNNDRDYDELIDVDEVIASTDMDNPDTDGDGLNDGEEAYYGTNPIEGDTDTDGYNDYDEIRAGSDPLDINSIPALGDLDLDGDSDGRDIAIFTQQLNAGTNSVSVADFAIGFGE
ncbi:MAG: right-handed parallel beta-helix repeat-containing protein [Proteobacteria bacterium]|nr:right-handed parallel beta-helix repeat-containing protein [Pseudomonadota bacterium]MBU4295200.1 right-handed parallel beta-helix repeat-containing protein [Pseudomonadota bacterium]MCG2749712.1 right-handed parallel beta-helix repeat-containing protein [Desulfobulbaceae bacterium]